METLNLSDQHDNSHKIIACDLNLCVDVSIDKKGTTYNNVKGMEILKGYMEEKYMINVGRARNPEKFVFTWKFTSPVIMSILSHFIVTGGTVGWIDNGYVKPGIRRDHSMVGIELYPTEIEVEGFGSSIINC